MKPQTIKEFLENNKIYYKEDVTTPLFKRTIPIKLKIDFYNNLKLNYGIVYANNELKEQLGITIKELKLMNKLTLEKYKCIDCKKLNNLIRVKTKNGGYANRCLSCYKEYWKQRTIKTNCLRGLNKIDSIIKK